MSVVLLTGAGISTAAGIPDFRGPQGVWTRDPEAERTSTLSWYLGDASVRRRAWQMRLESRVWEREPTPAHRAIAAFAAAGNPTTIITQNIDGLHQAAGSPDADVLEVHGTARSWRCEDCRASGPMAEAAQRVRAGDPDPHGPTCGGIIRAQTILFEEALDADVLDAAFAAAEACEVLVAVGTGLSVHPVAGLVPVAAQNGARTVIVNAQSTPFDSLADVVVRGDLQEELPAVLADLAEQRGTT
jgi:NAD-dependent deacetylase